MSDNTSSTLSSREFHEQSVTFARNKYPVTPELDGAIIVVAESIYPQNNVTWAVRFETQEGKYVLFNAIALAMQHRRIFRYSMMTFAWVTQIDQDSKRTKDREEVLFICTATKDKDCYHDIFGVKRHQNEIVGIEKIDLGGSAGGSMANLLLSEELSLQHQKIADEALESSVINDPSHWVHTRKPLH